MFTPTPHPGHSHNTTDTSKDALDATAGGASGGGWTQATSTTPLRQRIDGSSTYGSVTLPPADDDDLDVQLPPSLANLPEEKMAALGRAATRKVDILLMPTLIALYVLNFVDRNNVSTAKIGGITEDLGMSDKDFSTAVSVLFVGYISMQIPSNMIASRVPRPSVYICLMCALWGAVSALTGTVQSYSALLACRLLLGVLEAAFFPGALWVLSTFYTRHEIALRTGILYSGSQLGNAFGGLFALAILQLDGMGGVAGWRYLFYVEGALTMALALVFASYIPNRPETMRWLSPLERECLLYRLERDRATKDYSDDMPLATALRLALTDTKVWFVAVALFVNFIPAGITNIFPVIVLQLELSRTETLLLTAPPYILCIAAITLVGWHSDRIQERTMHIVCAFSVAIAALVVVLSTDAIGWRYAAMLVMPASFYSSSVTMLSWMSSTVVGPHVKRAVATAVINAFSNLPNTFTPYLYYNPPRYTAAFVVNLAASVLLIVVVLAMRAYLARLNRRLDRGESLGLNGPTAVQAAAGFRFQL